MFNLLRNKEEKQDTTTAVIIEGMTLEQVRVAMLDLMAAENINQHRMGQYYNHVVEKKLAEKAGYEDAKDFFSKHLADLSQATLSTYGAVARNFTESVAQRFGVTCLYLLLIYKEATALTVDHQEPGGALIEVPDAKGQVSSKPFRECTVEQMRQALRRKRKPASSLPVPPDVEVLADQYHEALKSRFPRGVRVKVKARNDKGSAVLDFEGIPPDQLHQLIKVLKEGLAPAREVKKTATG